jgi:hypothetical protein
MKITLQICFLSFILSLMLSAGCSKKTDPPTPAIKEIFPLKVGNTWTFKSVRSDSSQSFHVNEVIRDTLCDAQTWYILTYDTDIRTICKNTAEGWWFLYAENPLLPGTAALYYRYPATLNAQYMTADSSLVTVVGLNESVTVASGTFSCYHYHMIHYRENYECEEFFAPGTGFIKHIVYEPGTGIARVYETTTLVSFHLNGQ